MPNIKGIDLSDGVKILSAEINTTDAHYDKAAIEAYLASHDIAQTEEQINNFLAGHFKGEQIRVHIFSASPLKITCIVARDDIIIPDNWWQ